MDYMIAFDASKAADLNSLLPKAIGKNREFLEEIIEEGKATMAPDKENDEEAVEHPTACVTAITFEASPAFNEFLQCCKKHRAEYEVLDEICESVE